MAGRGKRRRRAFELAVRYSPRINKRFLKMVEGIAARSHMPSADVLRYAFEAALLEESRKSKVESRKLADIRAALDGMVTVRTTAWMGKKVQKLWDANPDVIQADVLRALLERILPIARDRGMAWVMKIREAGLNRR